MIMVLVWDYDLKKLKKSKKGRLLLLERQINYGVDKNERIKLSVVKQNWNNLHLAPLKKRLFELLIWNR